VSSTTRWKRATRPSAKPRCWPHCRRRSRAAAGHGGLCQILAGVDAAAITAAALAQLPVTRKGELLERQKAARAARRRPLRRLLGHRLAWPARRGARARVPVARPDLRTRRARQRLLALARAMFAAGFPRRRPGAQQLQLPPDARRLDDGMRRARAGLHGLSGRRGQHRAATAGDGELRADGYAGTPSFLRILLEKAAESRRRRCPASDQGAWSAARPFRRRCATGWRARHRGLPELRHRRPRPDRLRDRGARRPGARRRRDRRDRAPRHRRAGARGRGRRGGRHRAEPGLPADALRHRRPVGVLPGRCPTGRSNTAHQGLAGPRRPDRQGARHVRAPQPGGRGGTKRHPEVGARAWWSKARWPTTA
jgi:hypothetical protein